MSGFVSQAWVDAAVARALSDAVGQRDEARAEVERLRAELETATGLLTVYRDQAAAIQRVRDACDSADDWETAVGFAERIRDVLDLAAPLDGDSRD